MVPRQQAIGNEYQETFGGEIVLIPNTHLKQFKKEKNWALKKAQIWLPKKCLDLK